MCCLHAHAGTHVHYGSALPYLRACVQSCVQWIQSMHACVCACMYHSSKATQTRLTHPRTSARAPETFKSSCAQGSITANITTCQSPNAHNHTFKLLEHVCVRNAGVRARMHAYALVSCMHTRAQASRLVCKRICTYTATSSSQLRHTNAYAQVNTCVQYECVCM
jgi:hypothetical protein